MTGLIKTLGLALVALGAAAGPVVAQTLSMERTAHVDYDPFSGLDGLGAMVFAVTVPPGGESGSAWLIIQPHGGVRFEAAGPSGRLEIHVEPPRAVPAPGGEGVAQGLELVPGRTDLINVDLRLPSGQYADPGPYEARFDVILLEAETGAELDRLEDVRTIVESLARAQVNIAGSSGAFDPQTTIPVIDFGTLESGERREVFVQMRANAPSLVTLSSDNQGRLAHVDHPDQHAVDYSIVFDGASSDLRAPLTVLRHAPRSLAGTSFPLEIIIGDASGAPAGAYRDYLRVDVRPQ
jgi:hypothetical protein